MARKEPGRQLAFLFGEATNVSKRHLGGKGHGLARMAEAGLPVPPGFVITTGACRAFQEHGVFPGRLAWQVKRCVHVLERLTGRRFDQGGAANGLTVSVRSGAPVSMPGMMDTVLNVASWEQLHAAIGAVAKSWMGERAREYRKVHGISELLGTAVVVQAMVEGRGEKSGTGVVFSRNVATGDPGLYGEWLPNAQGEALVSGTRTPQPLTTMQALPEAYVELDRLVRQLEVEHRDAVDVEFTVEAGKLYLLQVRVAKRTPEAAMRIAVDLAHEGLITKEEAIERCGGSDAIAASSRLELNQSDPAVVKAIAQGRYFEGLPASGGVAIGLACFCPVRAKQWAADGRAVILVRQDTSPDDFSGMIASKAIVTATGGSTCHAAVVARGLGIPAVVGVSSLNFSQQCKELVDGTLLPTVTVDGRTLLEGALFTVDGTNGRVLSGDLRQSLAGITQSEAAATLLAWDLAMRRPVLDFGWFQQADRRDVHRDLNNFYLSDALAQACAAGPLAAKARDLRAELHGELAGFLATYLCVAMAELRHVQKGCLTAAGTQTLEVLRDQFGVRFGDDRFACQQSMLAAIVARCSAVGGDLAPAAEYAEAATALFREQAWSSSYGGPKWAAIAETLALVLRGTIDQSTFVDRVWDLEHNGGRLFDKTTQTADTNQNRLRNQLDAKRHATSLAELKSKLLAIYSGMDARVKQLMDEYDQLQLATPGTPSEEWVEEVAAA